MIKYSNFIFQRRRSIEVHAVTIADCFGHLGAVETHCKHNTDTSFTLILRTFRDLHMHLTIQLEWCVFMSLLSPDRNVWLFSCQMLHYIYQIAATCVCLTAAAENEAIRAVRVNQNSIVVVHIRTLTVFHNSTLWSLTIMAAHTVRGWQSCSQSCVWLWLCKLPIWL